MKKFELRQLIKEEIEKFISIQNFSPKDILKIKILQMKILKENG